MTNGCHNAAIAFIVGIGISEYSNGMLYVSSINGPYVTWRISEYRCSLGVCINGSSVGVADQYGYNHWHILQRSIVCIKSALLHYLNVFRRKCQYQSLWTFFLLSLSISPSLSFFLFSLLSSLSIFLFFSFFSYFLLYFAKTFRASFEFGKRERIQILEFLV